MAFFHAPPASSDRLPKRSRWLVWGARRYVRRYMARRVHAVRVLRGGEAPAAPTDRPVVVVMNHPSWWDPLTAAVAGWHAYPRRSHFGPIDRAMLGRYAVLQRLGLFGVEQDSGRGGAQFLRPALAITAAPGTALWVTAQGGFCDPRRRPVRLRGGVGRLASRMTSGVIVPMAVEMTFWDQRTPEVLLAFGEPLDAAAPDAEGRDAQGWTAGIARALEQAMDRLASAAITRDPEAFEVILPGRAGAGGVYDLGRRARAWLGGRRFVAEHPRHPRPAREEDKP